MSYVRDCRGQTDSPTSAGSRKTSHQSQERQLAHLPAKQFLVRALLQPDSYNATTTNFVPLLFESIAAAKPSLSIIDLVYGERAGWDLLARLHRAASSSHIPVVLMSTSHQVLDEDQDAHTDFDGDRHLTKPFDLDDLLAIVRNLIDPA